MFLFYFFSLNLAAEIHRAARGRLNCGKWSSLVAKFQVLKGLYDKRNIIYNKHKLVIYLSPNTLC